MKTQQEIYTRLTFRTVACFIAKKKEFIRRKTKMVYNDLSKDAPDYLRINTDQKWLIVINDVHFKG